MNNLSKLPLLPLRHGVVLPGRTTTIPVGRPRSRALAESLRAGDHLLLAVQLDPNVEEPSMAHLHSIATVARVIDKVDRGSRGVVLTVEAQGRYQIHNLVQTTPFWTASAEPVTEMGDVGEASALADSLRGLVKELAPGDQGVADALATGVAPGTVADRLAAWIDADDSRKVEVLLELDIVTRLRKVATMLGEAKARNELRQKIDSEVRKEFSKNQKEHVLRQQLKAIQKELGDEDGDGGGDSDKLKDKLKDLDLPEDVRVVVDRELRRLSSLGSNHPESNILRNYLELISELPWKTRADVKSDLDEVAAKLDSEHFGLEDVKRRILEHMAVLKLSGSAKGTILALVGPPGVGKTSLAQSVADATGRPLVRVSLGGVRDEAEIRGHRRTYIGALPGRLISALRKAKVKNPVVVLDEIDKLGKGWSGDPEAALLEVLDPEQNKNFTDHYLELPFDLSEVLFIGTANDISQVSAPLRDRLEIIEISGYTAEEKAQIAEKHLLAAQIEKTGLPADAIKVSKELLQLIINDYTREAGVRQLARELQKLARSLALDVARLTKTDAVDTSGVVVVDEARIRKVLGKPKYLMDLAEHQNAPGIAAGLAWTPVGGDILYIETTKMAGKGRIEITGQLGDVMKESAQAALAYLRSHADEYGLDADFMEKHDLHIHVPAGGVPKDGPSAGVTIFTALASLVTGRRVRSDLAMTGEATLRGRVLPIGGVKSKVLAAHRAGFKHILLPKKNERDLDEVPESVRADLEFTFAEDMAEVFKVALSPDPTADTGSRGSSGGERGVPVSA